MSRIAVIESARCDRRAIMIPLLILRRNNRTAKPSSTLSPVSPLLFPVWRPTAAAAAAAAPGRIDSVDGHRLDSARPRFDLYQRDISLPRQRTSSVYTQYLPLISHRSQSIEQTTCKSDGIRLRTVQYTVLNPLTRANKLLKIVFEIMLHYILLEKRLWDSYENFYSARRTTEYKKA